jgi:hypothetical protein
MAAKVSDEGFGPCQTQTSIRLTKDGYLRVSINGEMVLMHRHVYTQAHGKIPEGWEVHHKCENKACFNLDHLEALPKSQHLSQHKIGNTNTKGKRFVGGYNPEIYARVEKRWLETGWGKRRLGREFPEVSIQTVYLWTKQMKAILSQKDPALGKNVVRVMPLPDTQVVS